MHVPIQRALISVSDKTGVIELARALQRHGAVLISTGGTARLLHEAGLQATEVSEHTGFPEMLDGRVKTLHPTIHAGILARRDSQEHIAAIRAAAIAPIDLVAVNLYPFAQTVADYGVRLEDAIEMIDIGGPAMLRSAAKNFRHVAVLTEPADYAGVIAELDASGGLGEPTRFRLARKAFNHTAAYDGAISNYLTALAANGERGVYPERLNLQFDRVQTLRYGENPHQSAAFYRELTPVPGTLATYRQQQGRDLSYNNLADADAAWECVKSFAAPACVIVKHANPCGVAAGDDPVSAYQRAFSTDPGAAFGGIIAFNRELDEAAARAVASQFVEVLIAPGYSAAALAALAAKANVRVLQVPLAGEGAHGFDFKRVGGGLLVQSADAYEVERSRMRVATRRSPNEDEWRDLIFAWRVAKFVKSNAIVFARGEKTLGVGAGQMSRLDSARLAAMKAAGAGHSLAESVAASDAFFPFRDGLDVLAQAGARAVIQPGGSVRDDEVIAAADAHEIAMVLTGVRHFRH